MKRGSVIPRPRNPRNRSGLVTASNTPHPPQRLTNVCFDHIYRFRSTSDATTAITFKQIIAACGSVCTVANTTLTGIVESAKLHSVEVWTPPASQGATATCSIFWEVNGTTVFGASSRELSDTTNSVSRPAHIFARPPAGSTPSWWFQSGNTSTAFTLTAPIGSVIDVHVSAVLSDAANNASTTVAAGSLGQLYYPPLDGATDLYVPISLTTTT